MYAGDEFYDDDVTSGPVDYPREGPVPTAIQNAWNDAYDADDDPARCVACDLPMDDGDHGTSVCDDCSGLRGCVDDICHGMGYCMHVKDAWRP